MTGQRRRNRTRNASSGQKSTNQGGGSSNSSKGKGNQGGKKNFQQKRAEFKFQLHDPTRKGGYTFEKIRDAIILKIQKEFQASRYIVSSLRNKVKQGPAMPDRTISTNADANLAAIEQETFNRRYEAQLAYHFQAEAKFENNWEKAYGLVFDNFCSRDMQLAVKELPDFEARVRDNPLELIKEAEKLTHVPKKATYPTLALVETLSGLMAIKQGDKEGLLSYLE